VHHSNRVLQYLPVGYTERLAHAGAAASVGSQGDSYDCTQAQSFDGLHKTELIRKRGPWRGLDDVEYGTLKRVEWFSQRHLHTELSMVPPAEFEPAHYHEEAPALLAVSLTRVSTKPRGGSRADPSRKWRQHRALPSDLSQRG
jgi:putative transposase